MARLMHLASILYKTSILVHIFSYKPWNKHEKLDKWAINCNVICTHNALKLHCNQFFVLFFFWNLVLHFCTIQTCLLTNATKTLSFSFDFRLFRYLLIIKWMLTIAKIIISFKNSIVYQILRNSINIIKINSALIHYEIAKLFYCYRFWSRNFIIIFCSFEMTQLYFRCFLWKSIFF